MVMIMIVWTMIMTMVILMMMRMIIMMLMMMVMLMVMLTDYIWPPRELPAHSMNSWLGDDDDGYRLTA